MSVRALIAKVSLVNATTKAVSGLCVHCVFYFLKIAQSAAIVGGRRLLRSARS
jgi:hypothetical protein